MAVANLQKFKTCTKCEEVFPATRVHFYARKKSPDGLKSECKYCSRKARNKSYNKKKKEQEKEKGRWCSKCRKHYKPAEEYFYIEDGQPGKWCIKCTKKQKQEEQGTVRKIDEKLKAKYPIGESLLIHNINTNKWECAKITGKYEHFMTIRTKHYQTSIAWRDILTGYTPVREG